MNGCCPNVVATIRLKAGTESTRLGVVPTGVLRTRDKFLLGILLLLFYPPSFAQPPHNPNTVFADSSAIDFRHTLETPAGKRGFVTLAKDNKFRFEDGTRAKFWGVNISSTRLDVPNSIIEKACEAFARAGINMVRLEAIDNRNCLLGKTDNPTSRQFDTRYLDRIDTWIANLRKRGIYYYIDLLDFRTFKPDDGVINANALDRGARPYAVFDRFLIDLQKEFAAALLTHKNPYTGLRMVDDPALALVEICNEHGMFLYPEKLNALVEPYHTDLVTRWNRFLKGRYGTQARLAAAWGQVNGSAALNNTENLDAGTVDLPNMTYTFEKSASDIVDTRRAPKRLYDGVLFLTELQKAWFREMRGFVRSLGLRVPVTAVVSNDVMPDVASVAEECDFTSENWYGDTPDANSQFPGSRFYVNKNPLRSDSPGGFAPFTACLRWNNKPVVIREWAVIAPNRYRSASVPEALAYAALQDFDAMLLFGYQTNQAPNGTNSDVLNDFAFQADPTVWGLYALAGQAYLRGAIAPAKNTLTLAYPPERRFRYPNRQNDLHRAAYSVRVNHSTTKPPKSVIPAGTIADVGTLKKRLAQFGMSVESFQARVWRSDTKQITRYSNEGRLEVNTPTLRMLAGELKTGKLYTLDGLKIVSASPIAGIIAFSLDGKPLEKSRHWVVKMVTQAENTGQVLEAPVSPSTRWRLSNAGTAPVITKGKASEKATRIWLNTAAESIPLLTLFLENGTWELEVKNGQPKLTCDTPNIRAKLNTTEFLTKANSP